MAREPRRRPPRVVLMVVRAHAIVGITALVSLLALHALTRGLSAVEFGVATYAVALGLGLFYCVAAVLVWCGSPLGRIMSRIGGMLYLARPRLGLQLWQIMDSPEFRDHFRRERKP